MFGGPSHVLALALTMIFDDDADNVTVPEAVPSEFIRSTMPPLALALLIIFVPAGRVNVSASTFPTIGAVEAELFVNMTTPITANRATNISAVFEFKDGGRHATNDLLMLALLFKGVLLRNEAVLDAFFDFRTILLFLILLYNIQK